MLGLVLVLQLTFGQSSIGFAEALMRQGDYFRAITEYKRVVFHTENDSIKDYCYLQIARLYRKSRKFESAIQYSTMLLNRKIISPPVRNLVNLNLGMVYLDSHVPQLSIPYFSEVAAAESSAFPLLCLGLAALEMRNWDKASDMFVAATRLTTEHEFQRQIWSLTDEIREFPSRPTKSPLTAAMLSSIIPGSGQMYTGHVYDGLQAFFVTAASAFSTYALYRYEHSFHNRLQLTYIGLSLTTIFHVANVLGAHQTAQFYNWKQQQVLIRRVRDAVISREP